MGLRVKGYIKILTTVLLRRGMVRFYGVGFGINAFGRTV